MCYCSPKLSISSISVGQPKHLQPIRLPASFHDIDHLRHHNNMVPDPHQPTMWLIVNQLAF